VILPPRLVDKFDELADMPGNLPWLWLNEKSCSLHCVLIAMQTSNHIKLWAESAEKVIGFLVQILEFEVINSDYSFEDEKGTLLTSRYGNMLFVIQGNSIQHKKPVTINTSDCLKACFRLSAYGLKTINQPYYTDNGLAAEVLDQSGNHYILMEERILIEN
jgi:hypothetical protein